MQTQEIQELDQPLTLTQTDNSPFLYEVSTQTPWWIVSILLHSLVIVLAGLMSMAINLGDDDPATVIVTEIAPRPEFASLKEPSTPNPELVLADSKKDVSPTDPTSKDPSNIEVPPEILEKAVLGDHFETVNPDMVDSHSAFGNEDAHMFHSVSGSNDAPGGGGVGGSSLEDLIGIGGNSSPGTGGGWGGGNGTGIGNDNGNGHGSFGGRLGGRQLMVKRHGGTTATENSVELSLRWLAYHQESDGHWDAKKYGADPKTDTAVTGFALLAFLGAGHTEKVGAYKTNVQKAVSWIKSKQDANGMIWDTTDDGARHRAKGYPSAIATLALAEAAGMANIPDTRNCAQKAIDYCTEKHQQGEASDKGAWRYSPKEQGDLSVSGWFTMALKSAKVANLHVNPSSFDGAIKFLDKVQKQLPSSNPYPPSYYEYMPGQPHESTAHRLTMIGNLARQFMGWKKEDLQASVEWAISKGGIPEWGANGEKVDLYYWYYGTLCVFQQGGDIWKKWNDGMIKTLVINQCKQGDDSGSWNPTGDFSQEWGRVGQTALGCLCLEVYYRYALLR